MRRLNLSLETRLPTSGVSSPGASIREPPASTSSPDLQIGAYYCPYFASHRVHLVHAFVSSFDGGVVLKYSVSVDSIK